MRKIRTKEYFGWLREEEAQINKFVEERGEDLVQGSIEELETAVDKFCAETLVMRKDGVYEALLSEAAEYGTLEILQFIMDRVIHLPLIEEVDMEVIRNVDIPVIENLPRNESIIKYSPFTTEEGSAMEIFLESPYVDLSPKRIMWTDGEKLFFMDATPLAAAFATGNVELLERIAGKNGDWKGFYSDDTSDYSWIGFHKSKQEWITFMADEILNEKPCRLWSPEEAVILSGNLQLMKKVFESQESGELMKRLGSCALECDGDFLYKQVHKHQLPDAFYWLNEKESIYMDENYPELWDYYDLDKILASANYVLLTRYWNLHDNIKFTVLESFMKRIEQVELPYMTFGMLEDKVRLTGIHCIPISRNWLEKRKCLCHKNLSAFIQGKRGVLIGEEDLEECFCEADEAYSLGSFLKAIREEHIPGWYEEEDYEYENDDENNEWIDFGNEDETNDLETESEESEIDNVFEEKNAWVDFWESSY